jgi:hypothetical protein
VAFEALTKVNRGSQGEAGQNRKRPDGPSMTLGSPPASPAAAGCHEPVDRLQRACESVRFPTTKRWKHMVCYANVPPGANRGGSALNLAFLGVATTN